MENRILATLEAGGAALGATGAVFAGATAFGADLDTYVAFVAFICTAVGTGLLTFSSRYRAAIGPLN